MREKRKWKSRARKIGLLILKIEKQSKMDIKKLTSAWKGELKNALLG